MLLAGLAGLFSSGTVVTLLVTQDVRGAAFPASEYGTECSVAAVSETDGCTCYGAALTSTAISAAICTNGGDPNPKPNRSLHLHRHRSPHVWNTAAQRLWLVRPPARPASARSSSGRPPASASLGQLAEMLWLAGHTGLVFHTGLAAQAEHVDLRRR